jgi:hypothetical protein
MEETLTIEYVKKYNFYNVTCPEGYYITDYTDDKDIKDFDTYVEICCPGSMTEEDILSQYHLITEDENTKYAEQRDAAKKDVPEKDSASNY